MEFAKEPTFMQSLDEQMAFAFRDSMAKKQYGEGFVKSIFEELNFPKETDEKPVKNILHSYAKPSSKLITGRVNKQVHSQNQQLTSQLRFAQEEQEFLERDGDKIKKEIDRITKIVSHFQRTGKLPE